MGAATPQAVNALAQQLAQTLLQGPGQGTQTSANKTAATTATFQSPAAAQTTGSLAAFARNYVPQNQPPPSPGSPSPSPSPPASPASQGR